MKRWIMIHKIKALYDEGHGYSIRQISEALCMSRNTVKKYLSMSEEELSEYLIRGSRKKLLDGHKEYIVHLLRKYPKLSAAKVRRKLESRGLEVCASDRTLRSYVSGLKKEWVVKQDRYYEPVLDMVAGVQCQVDLGELRGVLIGTVPTTIYFGVFVLSYSRMLYVSVCDKPINTESFIRMHDEAFGYFDGVVEECVYDQTKLVSLREEYREVWFNEEFYRYASLCGFDLRVCEGYDPESKGKVESGVKYVKQDFFYGEEFSCFSELKKDLLNWLDETANLRVHGSTQKRPKEVYKSEERERLKPYLRPSFLSDEGCGETRQVDKTSLISYKSNKYSVPMLYQSSVVGIKEVGSQLIIQDTQSQKVIAVHSLCETKGCVIKNTNHYRDYQKLITDREREVTEVVGSELSEKLFKVLKATHPKIYKDQLVGLHKVLKPYAYREDLPKVLEGLSGRRRLSVSFIRDYLAAFYSGQEVCLAVRPADEGAADRSVSRESTGILAVYGNLSTPEEETSYDQL